MAKNFTLRLLIVTPIAYVSLAWGTGIFWGRTLSKFSDYRAPIIIYKNLADDYSGYHAIVITEEKIKKISAMDLKIDSYTTVNVNFIVPDSIDYIFPDNKNNEQVNSSSPFHLVKRYSQAAAYDSIFGYSLGTYTIKEVWQYILKTRNVTDIIRLAPYFFPALIEERLPWLYGRNLFTDYRKEAIQDDQASYDILGIIGLITLIVATLLIKPFLWLYYLLWVTAIWLGRVGWYGANLAFSDEGREAILKTFIPLFIYGEKRWILAITIGVSILLVIFLAYIYIAKHILPRCKRRIEDFFKIDKDAEKRKELSIENVEFKDIRYNINKAHWHNKQETHTYFLGIDNNKKKVFVEEALLNHHLHCIGSTGSGKTSLVCLPLSKQVIDKGRGCCFIDFKGDDVFKKYVCQEAERKGKNFHYFSIDPYEASATYNPLFSGDTDSKVDRIMSALELMYKGPAGFYSNVQAMTFSALLEEMSDEKKEINFKSVKKALDNIHFLDRQKVNPQEVKGLIAAISRFANLEILNKQQIDLAESIKNQDVVFFALKSQVNTQLAEAIGRMLIIDIKSQAVRRKEIDPPYFIFIDEFQNLSCTPFVDVISKVRSANFCLILSNQSRGDLSSVSPAFENTVFSNTATKIIFRQEDPKDAKFWSDKTGQTTYQEKTIRQFEDYDIDGKRSSQGSIYTARKNYITENVFLSLPFSKSIIFSRGSLARITNHEFLFNISERNRLLSTPFTYKTPGIMQGETLSTINSKQVSQKERRNISSNWWDRN